MYQAALSLFPNARPLVWQLWIVKTVLISRVLVHSTRQATCQDFCASHGSAARSGLPVDSKQDSAAGRWRKKVRSANLRRRRPLDCRFWMKDRMARPDKAARPWLAWARFVCRKVVAPWARPRQRLWRIGQLASRVSRSPAGSTGRHGAEGGEAGGRRPPTSPIAPDLDHRERTRRGETARAMERLLRWAELYGELRAAERSCSGQGPSPSFPLNQMPKQVLPHSHRARRTQPWTRPWPTLGSAGVPWKTTVAPATAPPVVAGR